VKPKTEEFLNVLLWTAEMLARPSFRNLTGGYESWAFRNGLMRQVGTLEDNQLVESDLRSGDRVFRLTERGRIHALGGRDPEQRWVRSWDGLWRMVLFDIPNRKVAQREKLRRYLKKQGFGCLQNSVWVSPDPLDSERAIMEGGRISVGSLLLLDARPCAGESDEEIVETAWNFQAINERYEACEDVLKAAPDRPFKTNSDAEMIQAWARREHRTWLEAVRRDPLLPRRLLPKGYRGEIAWTKRKRILARVAKLVRRFQG
jgi:phenylacetic acid degradation operon negative regulatory protein